MKQRIAFKDLGITSTPWKKDKKVQEPAETQEQCVKCGSTNLQIIYENNGFSYPDGPAKIEAVGVACKDCGHKEYD